MTKNYVFTFFLLLFLALAQNSDAQDIRTSNSEKKIENLAIYPNPVDNNRNTVVITTKRNMAKQIEFYNAIGKKLYATKIHGREINISNLSTGVYFLKITENNITETRKLVVN